MAVCKNDEQPLNKPCKCGGKRDGLSRRDFLKTTSLASFALLLADLGICDESGAEKVKFAPHLIPADKDLPAWWVRSLFEKGEPAWWTRHELATVGMPIGGIGTGQLFLCGNGTLGQWEIFNQYDAPSLMPRGYARRTILKPVFHQVCLAVDQKGAKSFYSLDETSFEDVSFRGEYPIGLVRYADPKIHLGVTLEAFSPFIPLNAKDSALPATLMIYTVENTSSASVTLNFVSCLQNPAVKNAEARGWSANRISEVTTKGGRTVLLHRAEAVDKPEEGVRPAISFADFESGGFGDWSPSGDLVGLAPSLGTEQNQGQVTGFQGKKLINTFLDRDKTTGTLLSPKFSITRKYISFLMGGGDKAKVVGVRLLMDGDEVRNRTGKNNETLRWAFWDVSEFEGREARIEIYDTSTEPWGHVLVDSIEFADKPKMEDGIERIEDLMDYGTLCWVSNSQNLPAEQANEWKRNFSKEIADDLTFDDQSRQPIQKRLISGFVSRPVTLGPGEKHTETFALAWHFPNTIEPNREAGHEYASRFEDAPAVADYIFENLERLTADTRKWRNTWYDSTLPTWLLDRIMWTASCLASGTVQWWKNGRFWAWEGVICCEGTCTHVWNYAQSLAHLFPELERNVRERQDLGVALEESGLVGFRGDGKYAADGQCGTILKVYREHLLSTDKSFLQRNWAACKKALEYSIRQDGNEDGLIENAQHNTYDIDFQGANTFVGGLYLAALRAAEEMAREMGEQDYAERVARIYRKGREKSEAMLWNGEYFIQKVDLDKHPRHQYGPGCLSDQMFGQNWAHQLGLGYIYSPDKVKKALESVWKYNWAPDTGEYNRTFPPQRPFAVDAEAGLFICTWPHSKHLDEGVLYRDEVWTGIEYQVASHMVYEGLQQEAFAICRAVHDRYSPERRNPFNEVECSDFYARAMSSWGMLPALSGFQYNGPRGQLKFAPRITPENFRCAFTAAEGWGNFEQKRTHNAPSWKIELKHGKLRISELMLPGDKVPDDKKFAVTVGDRAVDSTAQMKDGTLHLNFGNELLLEQGQTLLVS